MKNQSEVTKEEMSLNYKNNSLIHKFKIFMQIIVVVVVVMVVVVVNLFILYYVPHTIFIQISQKMPSKNPIRKLGFILYWKVTFILHQNQYVSAFRISLDNSAECILSMFLTNGALYANNNNGAWFGMYTVITPTEEKNTPFKILTSSFTVIMISGSKRLKGFVLPAICVTHQQFWNKILNTLYLSYLHHNAYSSKLYQQKFIFKST